MTMAESFGELLEQADVPACFVLQLWQQPGAAEVRLFFTKSGIDPDQLLADLGNLQLPQFSSRQEIDELLNESQIELDGLITAQPDQLATWRDGSVLMTYVPDMSQDPDCEIIGDSWALLLEQFKKELL